MNCNCGTPVRCVVDKSGKICYVCQYHRCRFCANSPIQAEGWRRIVPQPPPRNGSGAVSSMETCAILRFEALLHPEKKVMYCTATPTAPMCKEVLAVLEDEQFKPMWYVKRMAYVYPIESYERLILALRKFSSHQLQVEKIPPFFFSCVQAAKDNVLEHEKQVKVNLSQGPDPDDVVYSQLHPFQKRGVGFVIARGGRGMIADDMGLGKTVQAIAFAHHYRNEWPLLIICPLSLVDNWEKEIIRFCSIPVGRIATAHTTKRFRIDGVHSIVIVPYSSLKCLEGVSVTFKVVIVDESHYIKSGTAQRTTATLKLCRAAKRVLLLSGTPAMSRPVELYSQLQAFVNPSCMPSKTQFCARYCNSFQGRFGVDCTGHSNISELHALIQHFVVRRTKSELANELPSKSRHLLYLYITPKEKAALEKDITKLRECLRNGLALPGLTDPLTPSAFASDPHGTPGGPPSQYSAGKQLNILELRTATARAKTTAVQDYIRGVAEQLVETNEKMIVFAHHRVMLDGIRDAIESVNPRKPLDYILICGNTAAAQREELLNHFRTSPTCHLAVLSMLVCGVGLNLTCATMVVFTELDWNPCTHLQCEDRVHRIGQSSSCFIKYLLAEGTSDTIIWPLLQNKLSVTKALLEDGAAANGVNGRSDGLVSKNTNVESVRRSDLSTTPPLPKGRQLTLGECKSSQTSGPSTPRTPCTERAEETPSSAAEGDGNKKTNATQLPSQGGQTAKSEEKPVFIDIPTLQKQRQERQSSLVVVQSTCSGGQPAPSVVIPVAVSPQISPSGSKPPVTTVLLGKGVVSNEPQISTAEKQVCIASSAALSPMPDLAANITPAAAITSPRTTTTQGVTKLVESPATGPICSPSTQLRPTPPFCSPCGTVRRTPFVLSPAIAISAPSSVSQGVGGTCVSAVPSNRDVDDGVLLSNASAVSQSEALRSYNSRRTRFTVGSVGEKRVRNNNETGETQ